MYIYIRDLNFKINFPVAWNLMSGAKFVWSSTYPHHNYNSGDAIYKGRQSLKEYILM